MASYTKRVTKTKGIVWDVRAWDGREGVRKQVKLSGYATKKEAQKAIHDYFYAPEPADVKKDVSFAEAYETYKVARMSVLSHTTFYAEVCFFKNHILPIFDGREINLKKPDIIEWQEQIWNKVCDRTGKLFSQKTLTHIWTGFYTFMNWASEMYGFTNPFDGVKMPHRREMKREMNVWTVEEFDKFISVVKNPKYRLFFELLFYSGARKGEINALTTSDFKKSANIYQIKISKSASSGDGAHGMIITPPKTDSSNRTVVLPECLTKELDEYLAEKEGYLFGGEKPTSSCAYNVAFYSAIKKAGVKRIRIHDLRHSHASILIASGIPVTDVAKRLGHSTPKTTLDVYSHCLDKGEDNVISVLNGLLNKKK